MKTIVFVSFVIFCLNSPLNVHAEDNMNFKFKKGNCRAMSKQLNKNIISSSCKPRDTLITIHPDSPEYVILPNKVSVKLCDGGSCTGLSSCLPTRYEEVEIAVRQKNFRTKKESCGIVKVKQHSHCRCGCSVMEHHCTEKQIYKPRECICMCKNDQDQHKCASEGKVWDSSNCSCVCRNNNTKCTTGTEWIPSMCKCMKVVSDETDYYSNGSDMY